MQADLGAALAQRARDRAHPRRAQVVADVVGVPAARVAVRGREVEGAAEAAPRLLGHDLVEQPVAAFARGQCDPRAGHPAGRVLGRLGRAHAAQRPAQRQPDLRARVARVDRPVDVVAERDDAAPPRGQRPPRRRVQARLDVAAQVQQVGVDHRALERARARAGRGPREQAPAGVEARGIALVLVRLVGQPEAHRREEVERQRVVGRRVAGARRLGAGDVVGRVARDARDAQPRRALARVAVEDVDRPVARGGELEIVAQPAAGEIERVVHERVAAVRGDAQPHEAGRTRRSSDRDSWR